MNNGDANRRSAPKYYEWNGKLKLNKTVLNLDAETNIVFQQPGIYSQGFKNMEQILNEGLLCDITLTVDNQQISGHRVILAAMIPYFKAMFSSNMIESRQKNIVIRGIDAIALQALFKFAYTGSVDVNTKNVKSLIFGASFLQLTDVKDVCANFLIKWLNPNNVFSVRYIAEILICPQLAQATNKFIRQYFDEVSATNEFLSISADELIHIVKDDELRASSEEQIFEAIMKWVRADIGDRNSYLPRLLACVRLSLLNPYTFTDRMSTDTLLKSVPKCRDLLDEARDCHYLSAKRSIVQSFKTHPRSCYYFLGPHFKTNGFLNIDGTGSEAAITFVKHDFCTQKMSTVSSPCVIIRNVPWKICLVQYTNNNLNAEIPRVHLGYYIVCHTKTEQGWSCYANIQLKILSQKKGVRHLTKDYQYLFNSEQNNWGFSKFASWDDVVNPEKGYIKDDTVIFQAHIIVNSFRGIDWNSKKYTGFVGLQSEENTFYLNSLLQSLYFLKKFKNVIYKFPMKRDDGTSTPSTQQRIFDGLQPGDKSCESGTLENAVNEEKFFEFEEQGVKDQLQKPEITHEKKGTDNNAALAVQNIFYGLLLYDKAVRIDDILTSLNWKDMYENHHVEGSLLMLLNQLKNDMKNTDARKAISKLFEGKMETVMKCKKTLLSRELKKIKKFSCIQLNIKKCKNVYEAFRNIITTKNAGLNQYLLDETGLQDVDERITSFVSFPSILYLHLPRFELDPYDNDKNYKYNGRFEFYENIKLDPYLQRPGSTPANYTLYSVFVHSGISQQGSYVTFINAKGNGEWYKFDDDMVSKSTKRESIEFNYGGENKEIPWYVRKSTNAYMLVYVHDLEWDNIFA